MCVCVSVCVCVCVCVCMRARAYNPGKRTHHSEIFNRSNTLKTN